MFVHIGGLCRAIKLTTRPADVMEVRGLKHAALPQHHCHLLFRAAFCVYFVSFLCHIVLTEKETYVLQKGSALLCFFLFFFFYLFHQFFLKVVHPAVSFLTSSLLSLLGFSLFVSCLGKKKKSLTSQHGFSFPPGWILCDTKIHWSHSPFYQLYQENTVGAPPFSKQSVKWQALCFVLFCRKDTSLKRHHESWCLPLTSCLVFLWQLDEKRQDRDSSTTCYPRT